jgi:hypothetical protein
MLRAHKTALAGFGLLMSSTASFAQVGAMCVPSGVNPALYSDCRLVVAHTGQAFCQCASGPDRRAEPHASGVPGPAGPSLSGGVASPSTAGAAATGATTASGPTAAAGTAVGADVGTTGSIDPTKGNNGLGNGIDAQPPGNEPLNDSTGTPGSPAPK